MTDQPGSRSINVGGNASGNFTTGDHATQRLAYTSTGVQPESIRSFVELMASEIPRFGLSAEQESGARDALRELERESVGETVSPSRVERAMLTLGGYLSQAGAPAVAAAFMALAIHMGVAPPR
ncbi:hypothetical protein [Streptomyces melanogenes]|uniref:hypothetical protein n=1 Tax=Streptomyces melanogenes TaxID=67326 RepID=UPI00167DFDF6|nr:hypothetical protein [Streptomyces melanogenes]GGP94939.1 hypothetical protein GCM10010278_85960 [Streptomyces melanogenes]